jgi:hypothetical protein
VNKRPNPPPENKSRQRRRRRPANAQGAQKPEAEVLKKSAPVLKSYGVVFYENHILAKEDQETLKALSPQFDQLNIVIKAEGSMDDPELTIHGRVYAGEAWHLIHKRRVDDNWYNDKHE